MQHDECHLDPKWRGSYILTKYPLQTKQNKYCYHGCHIASEARSLERLSMSSSAWSPAPRQRSYATAPSLLGGSRLGPAVSPPLHHVGRHPAWPQRSGDLAVQLIGHLEVPVMSSPWRDDGVPQHWHVAARLQVYATKFDDFPKVHGPKKQRLQNSVYAYRTNLVSLIRFPNPL